MDNAETMEIPAASIGAYVRLLRLNLGGWQPQVDAWLHSDDAKPVLRELLIMVPCSPTLH